MDKKIFIYLAILLSILTVLGVVLKPKHKEYEEIYTYEESTTDKFMNPSDEMIQDSEDIFNNGDR